MTESAASTPLPESSAPASSVDEKAATLLGIVDGLVQETQSQRATLQIDLDSRLAEDLSLDSLGRTELVLRLEHAFRLNLPEQALLSETPRELLQMVLSADTMTPGKELPQIHYQPPQATTATPEQAVTLIDVLNWHTQVHPERVCIHLYGEEDQAQAFTYKALQTGARGVAAGLRERGLQPGQCVAIMLPTETNYFFSFFGTLLAGGIPVPIYPPLRPSQIEEHLRRHSKILENAQAVILITVPEAKKVAFLLKTHVDTLHQVVTVEELSKTTFSGTWISPPVGPQDIAFLQYTSGSTGDPKGVMLTHENLLANLRTMGTRVEATSTDVFISWLPLYHDMGLIGAFLGSLYHGFPLVVMSPLRFLRKPANWLWAIHNHRGTLSAGPNFAYELCLRAVRDEDIEGLDLSSWRMALNGAEPVSSVTLTNFTERFARYGFRPEAIAPVYGLAESSVGLALQPPNRGLIVDRIQRQTFLETGHAVPADSDDLNPLQVPNCGRPLESHEIRIVDGSGRELPERQEGRVEFRGPSCTSGYYRNPEATQRLFHEDWLDSGDRGYMTGGDIYLTGRAKEVIIRGGRNIYPYELEEAVGAIDGIRKGCVAVFASTDQQSGTERLVVVAETRETTSETLDRLRRQIREVSLDILMTPPDDVVLVPLHSVLKTSSGKLRRGAVRELYEQGKLGRGSKALWWQITRLAFSGLGRQVRGMTRRVSDTFYAAYVWAIFILLAPFVWVAVLALPKVAWRWQVAGSAVRLLLKLTGIPLHVDGLGSLHKDAEHILIANHASYLDSFILAASMPGRLSYVAKRELLNSFILRVPLKRLETLFVERFDLQRSAADADRVKQAVHGGRSLVFFPEGTFRRMPGLLPFRMGAFVAAAQAQVPIVPVAIQGTRSMLRAGSWFPRRSVLQVTIGEPILPEGDDWQAAVKLRDAARKAMLEHLEEPDLGTEKPL
jgi:1-acyl-sn-glycerol-3-phosphate acyltransferase